MKTCKTCSETKELTEYYTHSRSTTPRPSCKVCVRLSQSISRKHLRRTDPVWNANVNANKRAHKKTDIGRLGHRINQARRRAAQIDRTVAWSDPEAIKLIYTQAAELTKATGISHHVDHILPLRGALVSGFHHQDNLQIVIWYDNLTKSNKYDID